MTKATNKNAQPMSLEGLTKRYGDFVAVKEVSAEIEPGEFVSFLGPSGSGKTTILQMIAGLNEPSAGDIRIGAQSIVRTPVSKRNLGIVFQNYALFPHVTVQDNIAFPLRMRRQSRNEIKAGVSAALDLVRLSDLGARYPHELSGGQKQRVALARALVCNPRVLLLDEPLSALDANLREEMKFEIKRIHSDTGATTIFVTHDQSEALMMSDRIALFNHGELVQFDTPSQLYSNPASRFVATFIGNTNLLNGRLVSNQGDRALLQVASGAQFRSSDPVPQGLDTADLTMCVRPEAIRLSSEAGEATTENALRGVIRERLYSGDFTRYVLHCEGDQMLTVEVPTGYSLTSFEPGAHVSASWAPEAMILVPSK